MPLLKSNTTVYEFSLEEMKKLIASDLQIPVEAIQVSYIMEDTSDDRFGGGPNYKVTKIEVKIDETKHNYIKNNP